MTEWFEEVITTRERLREFFGIWPERSNVPTHAEALVVHAALT